MSVMLAKFLPDKLTVLTPREAILALRSAYETIEGVTPTPQCLAIHTAQAMLESGRFKSCHGYCFTNIKASTKYDGYFSCYKCNEQVKPGDWRWFIPQGELVGQFGTPLKGEPLPVPDGHPQTRFRAFTSAESGAIDHVSFEKRRYPEAYTSARAGDVAGFVHNLKARGFFTADEAPYLRGVSGLYREHLPLCVDLTKEIIAPAPLVSDDEICQAMACVAPDPERALHTEAVVAMMLGMEGMWDAVREERNRNLAEHDTDRAPPPESEA